MGFSAFAILLIAVVAVNGQSATSCCDSGTKYEDGFVCMDVNECLTNNGGCGRHAICINSVGSFRCDCKPGYGGDGRICTDINECATNNGGCDPEATCTNTPGSFTCTCNPGYRGDGITCTALPIALNYTLAGTRNIYSVLSFNNLLFVAQGRNKVDNQIEVYDNFNFQFVRYITISPANSPRTGELEGMAISPDGSVLYVSDSSYMRVLVVNLATSTLIANWPVATGPRGLSINSAGNLLVVCSAAMKIQEYTPSGSLVREINDNTNYFYHALELNRGSLLVSRYFPPDDVCAMSTNGAVSTCYEPTAGSGPGKLITPCSMAVDKHGYVLVADKENNRIMIVNPSLSQGVPLPMPDGFNGPISWPMGLWFDKSRARLYVGESGGSYRLLVFDNIVNLGAYFDRYNSS